MIYLHRPPGPPGVREHHNPRSRHNYHLEHRRRLNHRLYLHPGYPRSFNAVHPARLLERRCTCNPPLNPPVTQACYKKRVSARRLSFSQAHSSPAAYSACSAPRCSPTFSVQPVPPMRITRRFLYPTSSSPLSPAERSVRLSSLSSRITWYVSEMKNLPGTSPTLPYTLLLSS